jgi:hypothetical protein
VGFTRALERRRGAIACDAAMQPRHAAQQRRESGGRRLDDRRHPLGPAGGFHVLLAQVQQVALDLGLAGAPQIVGGDRHAVERVAAVDVRVGAQHLAVLHRERIDRSLELVLRQQQRRGDAVAVPPAHRASAGIEIDGIHRPHQRHARQRRRVGCVAVGDQGNEAITEYAAEVGEKGPGTLRDSGTHALILVAECGERIADCGMRNAECGLRRAECS